MRSRSKDTRGGSGGRVPTGMYRIRRGEEGNDTTDSGAIEILREGRWGRVPSSPKEDKIEGHRRQDRRLRQREPVMYPGI